jgi:hypothetical protein
VVIDLTSPAPYNVRVPRIPPFARNSQALLSRANRAYRRWIQWFSKIPLFRLTRRA